MQTPIIMNRSNEGHYETISIEKTLIFIIFMWVYRFPWSKDVFSKKKQKFISLSLYLLGPNNKRNMFNVYQIFQATTTEKSSCKFDVYTVYLVDDDNGLCFTCLLYNRQCYLMLSIWKNFHSSCIML